MKERIHQFAILIPHYNQPEELEQAIASCASANGIQHGHLVIVDDGSEVENSPRDIVHRWDLKQSFGKITFIENGKNLGVSETLNRGLAVIGEPYFFRLDSDDRMLPDRIESQIRQLQDGCDLSFSEAIVVYQDEPVAESNSPSLKFIRACLPYKNYLMHPTLAAQTTFFVSRGGYPEGTKTEDWDFWRAHLGTANVGFVRRPLVRLGLHLDSASNAKFYSNREAKKTFRLKTALRYWDRQAALREARKLGLHYYLLVLLSPNPYRMIAVLRSLTQRNGFFAKKTG